MTASKLQWFLFCSSEVALIKEKQKKKEKFYNGTSGLQTDVTGTNITMEWLTRKPKQLIVS